MSNAVKDIVLGIPVTKSENIEEYEKAIDWYVKVLGFDLIWNDKNSVWYIGNVKLNPHYSIHFTTDNIEQLQSDLIRSGVSVGDIHDIGGPDRVMMFFDPYGNRFWAWAIQ